MSPAERILVEGMLNRFIANLIPEIEQINSETLSSLRNVPNQTILQIRVKIIKYLYLFKMFVDIQELKGTAEMTKMVELFKNLLDDYLMELHIQNIPAFLRARTAAIDLFSEYPKNFEQLEPFVKCHVS